MTDILLYLIIIILSFISSILSYLYLCSRNKDTKLLKNLLKIDYDKKKLIFSVGILFLSVFIFIYSYKLAGNTILKAFMNAQVIIWIYTVAYIDLIERIIPNQLIFVGIIFWIILLVLEVLIAKTSIKQILLYSFAGGLICGGVLFAIAIIVRNALGMGDVKMFTVLGLFYGLTNTYSILLYSVVIMAMVSIVLLIAKKVTRKTAVPMAPFVAVGLLLHFLLEM